MAKSRVRRAIIREWMSRPRDKRSTPEQAAAFAKLVLQQHSLPPSRRDPYSVVIAWLLPRTGRA
jgi:hypothetical protein